MNFRRLDIFAILLTLSFTLSGCTEKGYTIKGAIEGDTEGCKAYLYAGKGVILMPDMLIDSTEVAGGVFEFTGELAAPELLTVKIVTPEQAAARGGLIRGHVVPLFIQSGTVAIDAALDKIPLEAFDLSGSYEYSNISVSGPELNAHFIGYMTEKLTYVKAYREANTAYMTYLRANDAPISQGVAAITKVYEAAANQKAFTLRFIEQNKDNAMGLFVFLDNLDSFTLAEIGTIETLLAQQMKESEYGRKVLGKAESVKGGAIGAKFTDFTLQDADGNPFHLSDHLGKGNYVLLEFWASWCGPCRAEIPHLKHIYEAYNTEGFGIVSVSLDADNATWKKAMEQEQMVWAQACESNAFESNLAKIYNFQGIPACFLIAPDGTIAGRDMRGAYLDKKLIEIYGNRFGDKF